MECVDNLQQKLANLSFSNSCPVTREGIQVANRSKEVSALENLSRTAIPNHTFAIRHLGAWQGRASASDTEVCMIPEFCRIIILQNSVWESDYSRQLTAL